MLKQLYQRVASSRRYADFMNQDPKAPTNRQKRQEVVKRYQESINLRVEPKHNSQMADRCECQHPCSDLPAKEAVAS